LLHCQSDFLRSVADNDAVESIAKFMSARETNCNAIATGYTIATMHLCAMNGRGRSHGGVLVSASGGLRRID
jgi:hypothetical protein